MDVNLRPISAGPTVGPVSSVDKRSIMFYAMPAQAYIKGKGSPCFIENENKVLSSADILGAKIAYPKDPTQAVSLIDQRNRHAGLIESSIDLNDGERKVAVNALKTIDEALKPLLYVHIQREVDRYYADQIRKSSSDLGFMAPGVENVSLKGLRSGKVAQVRYFRDMDADAAIKISNMMKSNFGKDVKLVKIGSYANRVSRNTVELWLP